MIDLDEKWDPPTREMLMDGDSIALDEEHPDQQRIVFDARCGAYGYFCSARMLDPVGYGGGKTPREALKSLALSLRRVADQIDKLAKER